MLTSEPFAHNSFDRAAVKVASPHGVGGYVLRMPKRVASEEPWPARRIFDASKDASRVGGALKVIPTDGCHRCVRRELTLYEIGGGRLTSSRAGWVPNVLRLHPGDWPPRLEPGRDAQSRPRAEGYRRRHPLS
ncbi:hypothetical protein MSAS_46430 [Mycobacterium saskatchewanense]|nr:hypothetical protein MSAS_46430 [Mycobacterium saskatchewanense]